MKTIIFLVALFVCETSLANAFFPVGKAGADKNYWSKADCEETEGMTCFDLDVCPLDECVLSGGKLVVDATKKAAKTKKIQDDKTESDLKEVKAANIKQSLIDCAKNKNPTNAEIVQCVMLISKSLVKDNLKASDL